MTVIRSAAKQGGQTGREVSAATSVTASRKQLMSCGIRGAAAGVARWPCPVSAPDRPMRKVISRARVVILKQPCSDGGQFLLGEEPGPFQGRHPELADYVLQSALWSLNAR